MKVKGNGKNSEYRANCGVEYRTWGEWESLDQTGDLQNQEHYLKLIMNDSNGIPF